MDLLNFVREPWMADAACLGLDPEMFHPVRGESCESAFAVCRSCPVSEECLAYALEHNELGIWGGTSFRERRRMRRRAAA